MNYSYEYHSVERTAKLEFCFHYELRIVSAVALGSSRVTKRVYGRSGKDTSRMCWVGHREVCDFLGKLRNVRSKVG